MHLVPSLNFLYCMCERYMYYSMINRLGTLFYLNCRSKIFGELHAYRSHQFCVSLHPSTFFCYVHCSLLSHTNDFVSVE